MTYQQQACSDIILCAPSHAVIAQQCQSSIGSVETTQELKSTDGFDNGWPVHNEVFLTETAF